MILRPASFRFGRLLFAGLTLTLVAAAWAARQPAPGTAFVDSADGTRIAYSRSGKGPPLLLVGGMFSERVQSQGLVKALAPHFTVYHFDRRGHGDSGNAAAYAVQREVEDVAAVAAVAGGRPIVYGHSSGAGLALAYAAGGQALPALILHEPPFGGDDPQTRERLGQDAATTLALLDQGKDSEAVAAFMRSTGAPEAAARQAAADPNRVRLAPTMRHDFAVMASRQGSPVPEDQVRALKAKTTVLVGSKAPPMFLQSGRHISRLAPQGQVVVLQNQPHVADPAVVASAIREAVRQ